MSASAKDLRRLCGTPAEEEAATRQAVCAARRQALDAEVFETVMLDEAAQCMDSECAICFEEVGAQHRSTCTQLHPRLRIGQRTPRPRIRNGTPHCAVRTRLVVQMSPS